MNETQNALDAFEDPLSNFEPTEYESEVARALAEDPVTVIELTPDVRVGVDTPVREAIRILHDRQVSSLMVVEAEKLVGIFTERDFLERVAEQFPKWEDVSIGQVMTPHPTVVYESDPVGAAVAAIAIAGHRHVPVIDADGKPLGIVSPRRVFRFIDRCISQSG